MLILLPPSEGKAEPSGKPATLSALSFAAELGELRELLTEALDLDLRSAPAARAAEVYTGVLYERLGLSSLPAPARRRANSHLLIASGLWGLLSPADRIPRYKLPVGEPVPGVGKVAALWRPLLAAALAPRDSPRELVVDCRSGAYVSLWRPQQATHVAVRAFREEPGGKRKPVSHMAKATRGDLTRVLLTAPGAPPRSASGLAEIAESNGMGVELSCLDGSERRRWTLDVIEREVGNP